MELPKDLGKKLPKSKKEKNNTTKRKKCPKGFVQYPSGSGNCIPKSQKTTRKKKKHTEVLQHENLPSTLQFDSSPKNVRKRCPKGFVQHPPKSGNCIEKSQKTTRKNKKHPKLLHVDIFPDTLSSNSNQHSTSTEKWFDMINEKPGDQSRKATATKRKKCPKGFIQHPPRSGNCIEKSQKTTRKNKKHFNPTINPFEPENEIPNSAISQSYSAAKLSNPKKTLIIKSPLSLSDFSPLSGQSHSIPSSSDNFIPLNSDGSPSTSHSSSSNSHSSSSSSEGSSSTTSHSSSSSSKGSSSTTSHSSSSSSSDDSNDSSSSSSDDSNNSSSMDSYHKSFNMERNVHDKHIKNYNPDNQEDNILYPDIDDPYFNVIITSKREFEDTKYDGKIENIIKQSDIECKKEYEISPNQLFVKNFLSPKTPYRSLLLYGGTGIGKTDAAIHVTEQIRIQNKQSGIDNKIMIIAYPNVQENFRLQLFDFTKLKDYGNSSWEMPKDLCNNMLNEINPNPSSNTMTLSFIEEKIKQLIDQSYEFIGYDKLAGKILSIIDPSKRDDDNFDKSVDSLTPRQLKQKMKSKIRSNFVLEKDEIKRLQDHFNGRLIVIDEVHNVISRDNTETKKITLLLPKIVKHCSVKLLMMSATPMYNSYREIIWLTNIMNSNDNRPLITSKQVFDIHGNFVEEERQGDVIIKESGQDLLQRKLIGYVSHVRGENPYVFPFRVYPSLFAEKKYLLSTYPYPTLQLNKVQIKEPLKHVDVFINQFGKYQKKVYLKTMENIVDMTNIPNFGEQDSFGYHMLIIPLSLSNITYPSSTFDEYLKDPNYKTPFVDIVSEMHGFNGLKSIMNVGENNNNFSYKDTSKRIFEPDQIGKYSSKIAQICESVKKSNGIVLIYSREIYGGLVPMALALESIGFVRSGASNNVNPLFSKKVTTSPIQFQSNNVSFDGKYVMITGDPKFSFNNKEDVKLINGSNNKYGEKIKVILISRAGSEGLDFKCIRQVHILDPWYNMYRLEQITGRAVRNRSHCSLPFIERNVEIYFHVTAFDPNDKKNRNIETVDMYMYRLAEKKAIIVGKVSRLLKENAIDCFLNIEQTNFHSEKMNQLVKIQLSTDKKEIDYQVGDKSFSPICDYMENCSYQCKLPPKVTINKIENMKIDEGTYQFHHLSQNHTQISHRLRQLFREKKNVFYNLTQLISGINVTKKYPLYQIYFTIVHFLTHRDWLVNYEKKKGYLIVVTDEQKPMNDDKKHLYVFQPLNISNIKASIFDRSMNDPKQLISASLVDLIPSNSNVNIPQISSNIPNSPSNFAKIFKDILQQLNKLSKNQINKNIKGLNWWYDSINLSAKMLEKWYGATKYEIIQMIIFHYIDNLSFKDRVDLMENSFNNINQFISNFENKQMKSYKNISENDVNIIIREYFVTRFTFNESENIGIVVLSNQTQNMFYLFQSNKFLLLTTIPKWYKRNIYNIENQLIVDINKINKLNREKHMIGYIKTESGFCIKNLLSNRPTKGAIAIQAGKKAIVDYLNNLGYISKQMQLLSFENKNQSPPLNIKNETTIHSIVPDNVHFVVLFELFLRLLTMRNKNQQDKNILFFLQNEQVIESNLDTFLVVFNGEEYVKKSH